MKAQLRKVLLMIQSQIAVLVEESAEITGDPKAIYRRLDSKGNPVLTPLLLAESNVLLALSNLEKK